MNRFGRSNNVLLLSTSHSEPWPFTGAPAQSTGSMRYHNKMSYRYSTDLGFARDDLYGTLTLPPRRYHSYPSPSSLSRRLVVQYSTKQVQSFGVFRGSIPSWRYSKCPAQLSVQQAFMRSFPFQIELRSILIPVQQPILNRAKNLNLAVFQLTFCIIIFDFKL